MKLHKTPSARRQQGAILIMTAAFIVAAVALLALAVDTGRLYAAQAHLQSAANLAALDSARAIGGCGVGEPANPQNAAETAATNAVANNYGPNNPVTLPIVTLGKRDQKNSLFGFRESDPFSADAVIVKLQRPAPTTLFGGTSAAKPLTATAGAFDRPEAGISIGSSLLNIGGNDGKKGLLAALLGTTKIQAISTDGLVNAQLSLGNLLKANANVGGLKDLLDTNLTLPRQLNLLADALDNTVGGVNNTAAATLRELAGLADPTKTSHLGQVLNIEPGVEKLVSALPINVASLVSAIAQAANKGTPISLPVAVDLGNLATAGATINIIQPPQLGFGRAGLDGQGNYRTTATTAQVAIQLQLNVLSGGLLGGGQPVIDLPLYVKVAAAKATLNDIQCAGATPNAKGADGTLQHYVTTGVQTDIADIGVGKFADINAFDPPPPPTGDTTDLVSLLSLVKITTKSSHVPLGGPAPTTVDFTGPFPPQKDATIQSQMVGTDLSDALDNAIAGKNGLNNQLLANLDVGGLVGGLLGPLLKIVGLGNKNGLLQIVTNLLKPVLNLLAQDVLEPIFNLLGLSLGNADVSVDSVIVNQPSLFCTSAGDCQSATNGQTP